VKHPAPRKYSQPRNRDTYLTLEPVQVLVVVAMSVVVGDIVVMATSLTQVRYARVIAARTPPPACGLVLTIPTPLDHLRIVSVLKALFQRWEYMLPLLR
jgi:hypothetical protein